MGDMNFPSPNTATEYDGWDWDSEKWTKWGSGGSSGGNTANRTATALGVMATGEMVIVNEDGTVSVVDGGITSGEVVEDGYSDNAVLMDKGAWSKGCFDSSSGKVVIAHKFNNSSDDFTALTLGTVSEGSVVFSTPYELQPAGGTQMLSAELVFDASSNSVVFFYGEQRAWDQENHKMYAMVISVSGDKIVESSVGPKCLLDDKACGQVKATFDPNSNQIVIAYCKWVSGSSNSLYVTTGKVSGQEITFSTLVMVSGVATDGGQTNTSEHFDVAFDPIADRLVVAWKEFNAPYYGRARAGKVVGDTIELGAETVWESSKVEDWIFQCDYEPKSGKIIIHFWGNYGANLLAGTVQRDTSDSAISFGSYAQYFRESVRGMMACDPYTGVITVAYSDMPTTKNHIVSATVDDTVITFGDATEVVEDDMYSQIQCVPAGDALSLKTSYMLEKYTSRALSIAHTKPDFIQTNLTTGNFIGVSKGDYADGAEATVQVAGINPDQQGMTIGKQYIQPDGSLDTTEGTPSVLAGTAISPTEINIKDLV